MVKDTNVASEMPDIDKQAAFEKHTVEVEDEEGSTSSRSSHKEEEKNQHDNE